MPKQQQQNNTTTARAAHRQDGRISSGLQPEASKRVAAKATAIEQSFLLTYFYFETHKKHIEQQQQQQEKNQINSFVAISGSVVNCLSTCVCVLVCV